MEDNGRILAIGAHPDDVEFTCAGTLSLLRKKGYAITIATMTPGDCGSAEHSAFKIAETRRKEAAEAATVLDAPYLCLEERDLAIDYNTVTRRKVVGLIREVDPFLVITNPLEDYMVDHEVTGRLVRDACFCAPMPNFGVPNGLTNTDGIPYLYYVDPLEGKDLFGNPVPYQFAVDVTSEIETKKEMLSCHRSQRDWLLRQHGMDQYVESMLEWAAARGKEAGFQYAEAFRQHVGHPYPHDNKLLALVTGSA